MIVKIADVFSKDSTLHVSFRSPTGNGVAVWIGSAPEVGQQYDVELNLDNIFYWGENIKPADSNVDFLYFKNGATHLVAELISVDDDNCAAIRIGGSVVLIEIDEAPAQKPSYVDLTTTEIHLHPTYV
ncbi:hypothetical protein RCO22_20875 [Pseudomonas yamanorum]|jgi:hypothetical protein|uniref:Uncharacterized protein n=1 Tax=Pseudomonas yamanorum TaxID=515393 RepID=A0ABU1CVW1_9PSED|nr:hypothetical protein [Pseudomonas yamanorum]MDR0191407.1 hypothetical protein [Pseudomonas yamanorum]